MATKDVKAPLEKQKKSHIPDYQIAKVQSFLRVKPMMHTGAWFYCPHLTQSISPLNSIGLATVTQQADLTLLQWKAAGELQPED